MGYKEVELLHIGTVPANAPDAHNSSAREFAEILQAGSGTAEVHEDVQEIRWSKLIVHAAWNPTCVKSRSRDAQFIRPSPGALDFERKIMLEVASIPQAVGYEKINAENVYV